MPGGNPYVAPILYPFSSSNTCGYFPRDSNPLVITCEDLRWNRAATLPTGCFGFPRLRRGSGRHGSGRYGIARRVMRPRQALGAVVASSPVARLLNRLPWGIRGYVGWLLFYPLSRRVAPPSLPSDIRRALSSALRADTESLVAEWGVGHDWIAKLDRKS